MPKVCHIPCELSTNRGGLKTLVIRGHTRCLYVTHGKQWRLKGPLNRQVCSGEQDCNMYHVTAACVKLSRQNVSTDHKGNITATNLQTQVVDFCYKQPLKVFVYSHCHTKWKKYEAILDRRSGESPNWELWRNTSAVIHLVITFGRGSPRKQVNI